MKHLFDIPEGKKIRLIINTDAKNEADDQFAIVHALLTPRFNIKGIIAAHFGERRTTTSMQESYDEVNNVLELMDLTQEVPVFKGSERALPDEETPSMSEGAELIIRESLSDDPKPLYVIFLGPITDLAAAYLKEPAIADRLTAVWIGGGQWPEGEFEFNLSNDINAANVIFNSNIPLWLIPKDVYATIRVSIAELAVRVKPYGKVGAYLYQQLVDFNLQMGEVPGWPKGEMWSLGDSPAVSVLLDDHEYGYEMKPAPRITNDMQYVHGQSERLIRWYHFIDSRFTLEDMYAKLQLHFSS
ncbi:nucleoside hydrolase [Paenibacillus sp. Root52]|uniref:nucleoside hydrolase n=1 Tax=Paenibacillus sp. Root52 TaxID=1736552 RepID=UPI0006FAE0AC|nr:nucleoside hydrolase [Paenibacillus sp. Root52]KQY94394.1 nucleoside hydrolase [Paenibacillus sp. Root52]